MSALFFDADPEVPEDFAELGFSGVFTVRAACDPEVWTPRVPCLLGPGWMALRVEGDEVVLVRRDENANVDAYTGRLAPRTR